MPQPKKADEPKTSPITRSNERAWWCPTGHSNAQTQDTCGRCGAVRDGDQIACKLEGEAT